MNDVVNENIIFADSLSPAIITQIIISKAKLSDVYTEMKIAEKYYKLNSDIENKTRVYYDSKRVPHDNPAASNFKIKSNFLRNLVEEKQNYCLSKTFILKIKDENNDEVSLSDNDYGKEWNSFLSKELFQHSYKQLGEAVNYGIAWSYVYIDSDGSLKLKNVIPYSLYPIWKDREHKELDRVVYNYTTEKYESLTANLTEYAEYWTDTERILFNVSKGYKEEPLLYDINNNPIHSQMVRGEEDLSWGKVPFIDFKSTDDEIPLILFVKDRIDAYEILDSNGADGLADEIDAILLMKGISPDIQHLIESRELMKLTKMAVVDSDGDARYIQPSMDIQSGLNKMASLKKDLIQSGYGVDFDDARFGGNPNQMVIQSLYESLNTYANGLERHFQDYINKLKYFFDKWYEFTGRGSFDDCQKYTVLVSFDRQMMINQSAVIDDTVKLSGTGVSQKTLLEFNPVVQDVDMELDRLEEEQKEKQKQMEQGMFNFPQHDEENNFEEE
jgi:SPP1 family phage portal protein